MISAAQRYHATSDLWLVTTYFNPAGFRRKRESYERFLAPILAAGLPLLTVECAFGAAPFSLADGPGMLRRRARDVLWQKERLINLAIASLPASCRKVAWIDGDVLFENPDWAVEAARVLDRQPLVQLFSRAAQQLPDGTIAGESEQASFAAIGSTDTKPARQLEWEQHGHTGYAWAARRELLATRGLYDRFVLGGADHAIAHAACGGWDSPCLQRRWQTNPRQRDDFLAWAEPFEQDVGGDIGCIEGGLLHLWHGAEGHRRYEQRHRDLADLGFDPATALKLDEHGCWAWRDPESGLRELAAEYFRQRLEDQDV